MITYSEIGGESGQARSSGQDQEWKRTYTRFFRAITDDPTIGAGAVRAGCGVTIGMHYTSFGESDTGSYATNIQANEDTSAGDGRQWIVTVNYSSYNALVNTPENPIDATPRIQFSTSRFQRIPIKDIDDEPILNSAGDPFDPPLTIDASRPFMTIVRNEQSFAPLLANDYKDSINAASWFGLPELVWKCLDISADEVVDPEGNKLWAVTYQFELNPDTWVINVLDVGMREKGSDGKKRRILDDDKQAVTTPWPLNVDGTRKPTGSAAEEIPFHIYPEKDFEVLNLTDFYNLLISSGRLT